VQAHISRVAALVAAGVLALAVATATAATSYTSKVTLSKEAPFWHGEVLSTKFNGVRSCERDRLVRVFRRRAGKDLKIGTDHTSRAGRWSVPDKPTAGVYYARVIERRAGDKPGCDGDYATVVVE
jgi:hypothetical protein